MAWIAPAVMGAMALYKAIHDANSASDAQNNVNNASANQLRNTDTAWRTIQLKRQEDANAMMQNLSRQMNSYGGAASVLSNMYGGQGSAPVGTGLPPPQLQGLRGPMGGSQGDPSMAPRGLPGASIGAGPGNFDRLVLPSMAPRGLPGVGSAGGPSGFGSLGPSMAPGGGLPGVMGGAPPTTGPLGPAMLPRPPIGAGGIGAAGPSSGGIQSLLSLLGPGAFGGLTGGPRPLGGM